jgi:hypothetical protein
MADSPGIGFGLMLIHRPHLAVRPERDRRNPSFGPPPRLLWMTCGNVANECLREAFTTVCSGACVLLRERRAIVEIGDRT